MISELENNLDSEPRSGSVDQLGRLEAALAKLKIAAVLYESANKWSLKLHSEECRRIMAEEERRCLWDLRLAAIAFAEAAVSYEPTVAITDTSRERVSKLN